WGWTTGPRPPHRPGALPPPARGLWVERLRASGRAWATGIAAMLCAASIVTTGVATFVNYIPDDVSTALGGLVLPLLGGGYYPPGVLAFLGLPQAVAGALPLAVLLFAAAWVYRELARIPGRRWPAPAALGTGLATLLVLGTAHALATQGDDADRNAVRFLQSVWLTPPGRDVAFWPRP
ncbi:hypothetical protein ACLESO_23065, partial [Pyxidicoccus sp. 3LG]